MATEESTAAVTEDVPSVPLFGVRKRARELASEVAELRTQLDRLGGLSVIELETRRDALSAETARSLAFLGGTADDLRNIRSSFGRSERW
jgi:hypothetical protein